MDNKSVRIRREISESSHYKKILKAKNVTFYSIHAKDEQHTRQWKQSIQFLRIVIRMNVNQLPFAQFSCNTSVHGLQEVALEIEIGQ